MKSILHLAAALLALLATATTHAAELEPSDGAGTALGGSASLSGNTVLVGADSSNSSAYLFRGLDSAAGTVSQNVRLTASDGAAGDSLGSSASLSGDTGLVGAYAANSFRGAAYLYRGLDSATGTVTQNVKLTASDGADRAFLGRSASLTGNTGLVGAYGATIGANSEQGAAYLYRGLDSATGTVTQNAKLIANDGAAGDWFGYSVSLSGNTGLVGAFAATIGANYRQGAAYLYRGLDSATGTVTQNVRLIASDGAANGSFGTSVSLLGSGGLVGATGANFGKGAAYLYRGLDSATGTVIQNAILTASDGSAFDYFGNSVSLSANTGLVGAKEASSARGAAYLYRGLDSATGTVTQSVKLTASDGATYDFFGRSVDLEGDRFVIGAPGANGEGSDSGRAYTGSVGSVTTLDAGSTSKIIDGISFQSQVDWVIGQTTDGNHVTLTTGDTANIGKAVYIGQNSGSDDNLLVIEGTLAANTVYIGSTVGNTGNTLQLDSTSVFGPVAFRLAGGNFLDIQGNYSTPTSLLAYLGSGTLQVWSGGKWRMIDVGNAPSLIAQSYDSGLGYTTISAINAVPEPQVYAYGIVALLILLWRKARPIPFPGPQFSEKS